MMRDKSNPIILVHGIARFDVMWLWLLSFIHRRVTRLDRFFDRLSYFRNVASTLRAHGYDVTSARLSFAAGVELCALELKTQVLDALQRSDARKVIIIAHSMGGLVARRMIVELGMDQYVSALATIGTPHNGTSFADWGKVNRGDVLIKWLHKYIDLSGFLDLTTEACARFNEGAFHTEASNDVRYIAVAASEERAGIVYPLQRPYDIIKDRQGENDGLVPVSSQLWQPFLISLNGESKLVARYEFSFPADHFNECGWWDRRERKARARFEGHVLDAYVELAELCCAHDIGLRALRVRPMLT